MTARILIVEDAEEILAIMQDILAGEGYEVVPYASGIQDLQDVVRVAPDLIILDYILGDKQSGWDLLQRLKEAPATRHIPILLCSAAVRELREIEGWLTAKGIPVVRKPFDLDELLVAVARALAPAPVTAPALDSAPVPDAAAPAPDPLPMRREPAGREAGEEGTGTPRARPRRAPAPHPEGA